MKWNRVSYILSYFFSKGSLLFANNKSISYKIDRFINYSNCQNWCCLLTSAGEVSCLHCIISGCDGPTELISTFVNRLIQPTAQKQDSYLKDTTDFLNFIESAKLPKNTVLASMDVTSLYTNIPHEEGVKTVWWRIRRFLWGQSPYALQLPKRNALPDINKKTRSNFAVPTTYKPMEQP